METSHASLQHILNIMSARSKAAKRILARCAGVSLENYGNMKDLNTSQADNEKQKLQAEANLRQQQVMDDFRRKQEAFFMQESGDDSSEDSDSSEGSDSSSDSEDKSAEKCESVDTKTDSMRMCVDGVENNEKTRPRSKGLQVELCALCHESISNTSKHGYPGMLGFV